MKKTLDAFMPRCMALPNLLRTTCHFCSTLRTSPRPLRFYSDVVHRPRFEDAVQAISHHLRHEAMTELNHQVKRVELVIFLLDWGVKKRALLCVQKEPLAKRNLNPRQGRALKFQTKTKITKLSS